MAYLIQQTAKAINVLDTSKPSGEQIIFVFSPLEGYPQIIGNSVRISNDEKTQDFTTSIAGLMVQSFGGSATLWTGTNDDLITLLSSFFGIDSVGGANATVAKQDEQIQQATDYFAKKNIGKILDLANTNGGNTWAGYPLNLVDPPLISFIFNFGIDFKVSSGVAIPLKSTLKQRAVDVTMIPILRLFFRPFLNVVG